MYYPVFHGFFTILLITTIFICRANAKILKMVDFVHGDQGLAPHQTLSKNVILYGSPRSLPQKINLKAGPLNLVYEHGDIRHVKYGDCEALRMIFVALRNPRWHTLDCDIQNESIEKKGNSFVIRYNRIYDSDNIQFRFVCSIHGKDDGTIVFSIDGESLSDFKTNRIGFNVLHPIEECAGRACVYTNTKQKEIKSHFPIDVEPHSPFTDIVSMRWPITGTCWGILEFQGEVFETEDHRNWTDASYKTYGRPLHLPKPIAIKKGRKVSQSITFRLSEKLTTPAELHQPVQFNVSSKTVNLPNIGIGRSTTYDSLHPSDISFIKQIGFHHYRVTLQLDQSDWLRNWKAALHEASRLDLPLELVLLFSDQYAKEVAVVVETVKKDKPPIKWINVFSQETSVTPDNLMQAVKPPLKTLLPDVPIGGGSKALFVDLNRHRPDPSHYDFLTYAVNPQRHAFDNTTLIENMQGAAYSVTTTKQFGRSLPVHVSPIDFKSGLRQIVMCSNPHKLLPDIDARQISLFGAGWTLGILKHLTQAGAGVLTYYETTGLQGIMQGPSPGTLPGNIQVPAHTVFPMAYIFREVLRVPDAKVIVTESSEPLTIDGMALTTKDQTRIILAHYTNGIKDVMISPIKGTTSIRHLDEVNIRPAMENPDAFSQIESSPCQVTNNTITIHMKPYSIIILDIDK